MLLIRDRHNSLKIHAKIFLSAKFGHVEILS